MHNYPMFFTIAWHIITRTNKIIWQNQQTKAPGWLHGPRQTTPTCEITFLFLEFHLRGLAIKFNKNLVIKHCGYAVAAVLCIRFVST